MSWHAGEVFRYFFRSLLAAILLCLSPSTSKTSTFQQPSGPARFLGRCNGVVERFQPMLSSSRHLDFGLVTLDFHPHDHKGGGLVEIILKPQAIIVRWDRHRLRRVLRGE